MNYNLNNQLDVDQLLRVAIKASIMAGEEILDVYDSAIDVEMKEDKTPLTQADKRAHKAISFILEPYGLPILSEEGRDIPYSQRKDWKQFWLVDPLDGTKEFIKRNGEFTVNIALVNEGKPLIGIIFSPVHQILYFGALGWNARKLIITKDESGTFVLPAMEQGEVLPVSGPERPFTVVCSRSHMSPDTEEFVDKLKPNHPDLEFASIGSSLKLCLIAEGSANVYPRLGPTMEWDTAAGQAIVEHSGGAIILADSGKPMVYNKENLLNPWFVATRDINNIP